MEKGKRKAVTMDDIAQKLGVSKNAVSLALGNKPGVSEELREKVYAAARRMHYRMPGDKSGVSVCLAVLVPEYIRDDGSFYSDIFWAIEHEAHIQGYMTLTVGLSKQAEQERTLPNFPEGLEIQGYLAVGIISREYLQCLLAAGLPVVCVDICNEEVPASCVTADNVYGGYLATRYLLENGHRQIGFAGPVYSARSVFERWSGYQEALYEYGVPLREQFSILGRQDGFELLDDAAILGRYLEKIPAMPTAWFCAGDMIAVSMVKLLTERGIRVPQEVSVMGFDDLKIAEIISPPLTTIHVDRKMMGRYAVHQLLRQIFPDDLDTHLRLSLPCALMVRQSVARISG